MKFIHAVLLMMVILGQLISAQEKFRTLESIIDTAIALSPKIRMLSAKMNSAELKAVSNSNLPDPTIKLGLINIPTNSFSFSQEPMTGKIVGIGQSFPFPGKLSSEKNFRGIDAVIIKQEIEDAKNELRKNITEVYHALSYYREAIKLTKENQILLNTLADVVSAKYSVSEANLQNVIKLNLELSYIKEKLIELNGKEKSFISAINSFLLRNPFDSIYTPAINPINFQNSVLADLDTLSRINRPFLLGLEKAKEKAKRKEELAKYEYYPNFNLYLQYTQRDHIAGTGTNLNDFLSFIVGFNLPLNYGGKKSAKIEEAKIEYEMINSQYNASLQILSLQFGKALAKLEELANREKLILSSLIPQAEQTFEAALAGYQANKIDFINVIEAQKNLLDIKIKVINVQTDFHKEIANLEFLVGIDDLYDQQEKFGAENE